MTTALTRPIPHPRIGLVLGGGGARGLGHVLMLDVFEELGIAPSVIAGTSIGAIYGAAFASGMPARLIRAHTEELLSQRFDLMRQLFSARAAPVQQLLSVLQLRSAMLNAETLLELVLPGQVPQRFSDLRTRLMVVATDYHAHEQVVLSEGALRSAVAASMALPALFAAVQRDGRVLMDGGLVNPLPFDILGAEADVTVAIDVSGMPKVNEPAAMPSARAALLASWQIPQRAIVMEKLKSRQPDIYIDLDVDRFHVLEFHRYKEILAAAEPAQERLRTQLLRVLGAETVAAPAAIGTKALPTAPARRVLSPPKP